MIVTKQIFENLEDLKIEKVFLLVAFIFGMITIFVTPPFQVPDEFNHFYRAYELSEGKIVAQNDGVNVGGYLPVSIPAVANNISQGIRFNPEKKQSVDVIISAIKTPLNPGERAFVPFQNTAAYTPVPYLPQTVSIFILRVFNFTPIIIFYCSRIITFLTWMIITYFAIKMIPFGKILLLTVALLPMTMFQAASVSADAVTISLSFLTIALFLHYSFTKDILHNNDVIILIIVTILLSLCKYVYFPLSLLFFLIPVEKIGTNKRYFSLAVLLICLNIVTIGIWAFITRNATMTPLIQTANPEMQIQFMLLHPFFLIVTLINTYLTQWMDLLRMCIGVLGWLDTALPRKIYELYIIMLLAVALLDGHKISVKNRILFILVFLLGLSITGIALYITWTPVGNNIIIGLQGRYFIPYLPLLLLAICKFKVKYLILGVVPLLIVLYSISLITLFSRYYLIS